MSHQHVVALYMLGDSRMQSPQGVLTPHAAYRFSLAIYLIMQREDPVNPDTLVRLSCPLSGSVRQWLRSALHELRKSGIAIQVSVPS